jgi:hypothetical protein
MGNWGSIVAAYTLTALSLIGYLWHLRQTEQSLRGEQETHHVEQ